MCKIDIPKPDIPLYKTPPDLMDEQVALARKVQQQNAQRTYAGLRATISGSAAGVTERAATSGGARAD